MCIQSNVLKKQSKHGTFPHLLCLFLLNNSVETNTRHLLLCWNIEKCECWRPIWKPILSSGSVGHIISTLFQVPWNLSRCLFYCSFADFKLISKTQIYHTDKKNPFSKFLVINPLPSRKNNIHGSRWTKNN